MRLKVIILRQNACTDQLLLKNIHEIQKVFGTVVADVVNTVRRQRESVFTVLLFGSGTHYETDTFHDVIHVSKVALAVAEIEDLDGLALDELVGKSKVSHIGSSRRSVNGEEAKTGGRNVVKLGVSVCHQLVAFLGGGVKADGIVHLILSAVRDLFIGAVNGGAGRIDQMLHGKIAASLKDIEEARHIGFHISGGIGNGITNASLSGKVYANCGAILLEGFVDQRLIGKIALDKDPLFAGRGGAFLNFGKTVFLDGNVVVVVYVVKAYDADPLRASSAPLPNWNR